METLIGIYEVAEIAGVSPSAVANWRTRSTDFPSPLAELKSGPVFSESQVRLWLSHRDSSGSAESELIYDQLAAKRGDPLELREKVDEVVRQIEIQATSTNRPGILLGGVQSGKTRAFLGVIARAFDRGYESAIILTKGTKSLAEQTLSRVKEDFRELIAVGQVEVFDILSVPDLTPYELSRRLIFVVKKEDDNLRRLLAVFRDKYPALQKKSVLIIDDEADLASISFRKSNGITTAGIISQQIDLLRESVTKSAFLQVTATPYALYLQPEQDLEMNGSFLFKPKRPAFTVLLPPHSKYVGGEDYFEKSTDPESPASYLYREVPIAERDALKKEDRRRLQLEKVLVEKNVAVLRDALVAFLVAGSVRRIQQRAAKQWPQNYSFLFHTEQSRSSHEWQMKVARAIRDSLVEEAASLSPLFQEMIAAAYADLSRSVELDGGVMPALKEIETAVSEALESGQLMITKVNSDNEIKLLLAENGQLKLRTPFNLFIGGQILDRGITIGNLIGFYYGRNPKRFQQDTVLQHSRMYGARSKEDFAVTRLYAPINVHQIMRRIYEFDAALREAFESGAHDRGVYFIQKDASNRLIPCNPNKLLFSDIVSVRPGRRLVLSGFQTVYKSNGSKRLLALDSQIDRLFGTGTDPILIDVAEAVLLLKMAYENLEFDDFADDDRAAHLAAIEHLSATCRNPELQNKVWLLIAKGRNVRRYRDDEGRYSNAPDTKQQKDAAVLLASDAPVLMMLRQNGEESKGWRGLAFWWPVIVTPRSSTTSIFASAEAARPSAPLSNGAPRTLTSDEAV